MSEVAIAKDLYDIVKSILPKNWKNIILYAGFVGGSFATNVYIKKSLGKYQDMYNMLPKREDAYPTMLAIQKYLKPIRDKLSAKNKWNILTFSINNKGDFKFDYDYNDYSNKMATWTFDWEKKYL